MIKEIVLITNPTVRYQPGFLIKYKIKYKKIN